MGYYNFNYLVIFLLLNGVCIYLNNAWTLDKGYLLFIIILWATISFIFWGTLSTISFLRKAKLKNELFYYIGIAFWNILFTIDYFILNILEKDNVFFGIPYFIIIIYCLIPIRFIWKTKKAMRK